MNFVYPVSKTQLSYLYVIGSETGPQKVGISYNPAQRLRSIINDPSHEFGRDLDLVSARRIDRASARKAERYAHWVLRDHHVKGEWFSATLDEAKTAIEAAGHAVEIGAEIPDPLFGGPGRPRLAEAVTPAERTRKWREERKRKGSRELNVSLTPENTRKAELMIQMGLAPSLSAFINKLVEEY